MSKPSKSWEVEERERTNYLPRYDIMITCRNDDNFPFDWVVKYLTNSTTDTVAWGTLVENEKIAMQKAEAAVEVYKRHLAYGTKIYSVEA